MNSPRILAALVASLLLVGWCSKSWGQVKKDPEPSKGDLLYQEGRAAYYEGKYEKAERLLLESLATFRKTSDTLDIAFAKTYYRLGDTYRKLRNNDQALRIYETTEQRYRSLPRVDSLIFADLLLDRGNVYSQMYEPQRAIESFDEALALYSQTHGPLSEEVANAQMNIGLDLTKAGMYQLADDRFQKAHTIFKVSSDSLSENFNRIYANRGVLYRKMGDYERALEFGKKALKIKLLHYEESHPSVGKYYRNIGVALRGLGRIEEAIPLYEKCLSLTLRALGEDHPTTAGAFGELAGILADAGRFAEARKFQLKANRLMRGEYERHHPYVVAGTFNLGRLEEDAGRYDAALEAYKKSRNLLREGPEPQARLLAKTFEQTALVRIRQGLPEIALAAIDSAIFFASNRKNKSSLLGQLAADRTTQQAWIRGLQDELANIDLLDIRSRALAMLFHQDSSWTHATQGLQSAELGALIIAQLRGRFPGQQSRAQLRERAGSIYQRGIALAQSLYHKTGEASYLERALQLSNAAKAGLLRDQLRREEVWHWAELTSEEQEKLKHLQSKMQGSEDSEATFAYYSFEQHIRQNNPRYKELSGSQQTLTISQLRDALPDESCLVNLHWGDSTVHALTISKDAESFNSIKITSEIANHISRLISISSDYNQNTLSDFLFASHKLYNIFLAPGLEANTSINKLIISPDGPLHGISFAALLTDSPQQDIRTQDWLLKKYAISYTNAPGMLLNSQEVNLDAFADAWLGMAPTFNGQTDPNSARDGLSPLRFNLTEVEQLATHYGGRVLLADQASKSAFLKHAGGARILHLATHAVLDPDEPMRSCLYFSPSENGETLRAGEIYAMNLTADLAVLSACATGSGKLQTGEGAMSLERAFKFAGAKAVIATRWLANDRSTSEVLQYFYANLANGKKKSEALQAAQLYYLNQADPLTTHPYFWAGIVISGNDDELVFTKNSSITKWILISLAVLGLVLFLKEKR